MIKTRLYQAVACALLTALPLVAAVGSQAAPRAGKPAVRKAAVKPKAAPAKPSSTRTPASLPASVVAALSYNRDVRPILAENCFACHGPDSAARMADLRLDQPSSATAARGERRAIVPGKPAESELVRRIKGVGPLMPPVSSHKKLTPQQIKTLERWVAEGAKYEAHWSFIPPVRPQLPAVKNGSWVRNPIDRFILSRLEKTGLTPAPEADRRTLARRVSLDVTGLPPDPADVEAFVNDRSPDAYEKYVDRMLASPHWGEHRGRYWLDAARYADTHGIHFDNFREIWSYRNWVVEAFNKNMPFDQFTVEQLAGDLLPNPSLDQLIATGFNRCNITTNEGGIIDEEYKVLYTRDRTETVAAVWLGSTVGCAVCHDHKFDPISQKEFYELSAFFNNTTQPVRDGNVKDTPPTIPVPLEADRARFSALTAEIAAAEKAMAERKSAARPAFDAWLQTAPAGAIAARIPSEGLHLHAPLDSGSGSDIKAMLAGADLALRAAAEPAWIAGHAAGKAFQRKDASYLQVDGAGDRERDQPYTAAAWVKLATGGTDGALVARMDDGSDFRGWDLWFEGGRPGSHIIHKWPGNAIKVVARDPIKVNEWRHVAVTYDGSGKAAGVKVFVDGKEQPTTTAADTLSDTIRTEVPLKISQRHTTSPLEKVALQELRLYEAALAPSDVAQLATASRAAYLAARPAAELTDAQRDELFAWWLPQEDDEYVRLTGQVSALKAEDAAIRQRGTIAHITAEKETPAVAHILYRGEYDKPRDEVKPSVPAILPPLPEGAPANRLGLARWLLRDDHPLTSRVTVNRFWQEVFGTGLVRTSGDFGITGEQPVHPELLDWLAVEFRESGWDIKRFFKLMLTSAAYRQSAQTTPQKLARDRDNRLISRGPRYRMDAEMIRDYALAASGLLVRKLGGPSVKPYQPDGVWEAVAMIGSNTRNYQRDSGENLYRRSLYTFWKRSAPPASMDVFNAPSRETCTVNRERTNTPLQALVTLNDVQFVEAARHLAQRALKEGGAEPAARVDWIARRLLARPLSPDEQKIALGGLKDLEAYYLANPAEAKALVTFGDSKPDESMDHGALAGLTMLVNELMNLDEVLNK